MIIVPIKEGENIERALKKFKRKFEKTGAIRELRARKNFEKPSVKRRAAKIGIFLEYDKSFYRLLSILYQRHINLPLLNPLFFPLPFFLIFDSRLNSITGCCLEITSLPI